MHAPADVVVHDPDCIAPEDRVKVPLSATPLSDTPPVPDNVTRTAARHRPAFDGSASDTSVSTDEIRAAAPVVVVVEVVVDVVVLVVVVLVLVVDGGDVVVVVVVSAVDVVAEVPPPAAVVVVSG